MRIAILGGGPGGYSAAFEAARLGAEVTLVERDRLGGTCLNWGCIPTKTILRSAHIVSDTTRAAEFGLSVPVAKVDVDVLRMRKEGVVDTLVGQLEATARRLKVHIVAGEGRLVGPKAIEVSLAEGGTETVEADAVILATGSVVFKLPNIDHDLDGVWTSDEAVALTEIPGEIVIIGGGVIGLEFACAYASFGSKVTVVELMDQLLPGNDKRVAKIMQTELEELGVAFHLGDAVESVEQVGERMRSTLKSGGTVESDIVMSAVGRVPQLGGFRLRGGRARDGPRGDQGRRVLPHESARRLRHRRPHRRDDARARRRGGGRAGGAQRHRGVQRRADRRRPHLEAIDYSAIPAAVYTFPGVGVVGSTRDSAKERGIDAIQAVAKFAGNGKALGEGEAEGFVQLVAEKGTGAIVGCQIVGPTPSRSSTKSRSRSAGGSPFRIWQRQCMGTRLWAKSSRPRQSTLRGGCSARPPTGRRCRGCGARGGTTYLRSTRSATRT